MSTTTTTTKTTTEITWIGVSLPFRPHAGTYGVTTYVPQLTTEEIDEFAMIKTVADIAIHNPRLGLSPTACRIVKDQDPVFYRDQQDCIVWAATDDGRVVDIANEPERCVAHSIAEFLARIKMENGIWFKTSRWVHLTPADYTGDMTNTILTKLPEVCTPREVEYLRAYHDYMMKDRMTFLFSGELPTLEDITQNEWKYWVHLCGFKGLEVIRWVMEHLNISEVLRLHPEYRIKCLAGLQGIRDAVDLKWALDVLAVTREEAAALDIVEHAIFRLDMPLLRFVVETYGIPDVPIKRRLWYVRQACRSGCEDVAMFLLPQLALPKVCPEVDFNDFVKDACSQGHIRVYDYVMHNHALSREGALLAFTKACTHGHTTIFQDLEQRYRFTMREVKHDNEYILMGARAHKHDAVVEWILEKYYH